MQYSMQLFKSKISETRQLYMWKVKEISSREEDFKVKDEIAIT